MSSRDPGLPPPAPRRRLLWAGAVLAVAVVVAAAVALTWPERFGVVDTARPGQVVAASPGEISGRGFVVQLPMGPVEIQVGSPTREIPDHYGSDVPARTDSEHVFVPVAWTIAGDLTGPLRQPRIVLVAGGHRYDLRADLSADGRSRYAPVVRAKAMYAVVAGAGTHLAIEVTYDDVTQTVDVDTGAIDAGVAARYYPPADPPLSFGECRTVRSGDLTEYDTDDLGCTLTSITQVAYLPRLGWVPSADQTWVVVVADLAPRAAMVDRDDGRYAWYVLDSRVAVSIDGHRPVTDLSGQQPWAMSPTPHQWVFLVDQSPTQLRLTQRFSGRRQGGEGGPETLRYTSRQRIPLAQPGLTPQ